MLDLVGQTIHTGDVIAYAQRNGDQGTLSIGLVIDRGGKQVHGFRLYKSGWTPRSKPGKLNNYERAIKIKPSMILDPDLRQAIAELTAQYDLDV